MHSGRTMIVGCLLARDFADATYRLPRQRLEMVGIEVCVIGLRKGQSLLGLEGHERVWADVGIEAACHADLAGIYIPGGSSPDRLRAHPRVIELVQRLFRTGRPIGAIGHGPQILLTAGLVRGRRLTASPTVRGDLMAAGAIVLDREVVVDGNLVTTRGMYEGDLDAFSIALLSLLGMFPDQWHEDVISVQLSG